MADATVALDLGQTLDVQRNITAKIALDDDVVLIDILADLGFVLGREILDPDVRVDPVPARIWSAVLRPMPYT